MYPLIKVGLLTERFLLYLLCELKSVLQVPPPSSPPCTPPQPRLLLNMCPIFTCTQWLWLSPTLPLLRMRGPGSVPSESTLARIQIDQLFSGKPLVSGVFFSFLQPFCLDHVAFCCAQSLLSYSSLEMWINKLFLKPSWTKPRCLCQMWCVYKEKQIYDSLDLSPLFILNVNSSFNIVGAFR